jgi:hypothetical protein
MNQDKFSGMKPRNRSDQMDRGLAYNGQEMSPESIYRYNRQFQHNPNCDYSRDYDRLNFGIGPRKGNTGELSGNLKSGSRAPVQARAASLRDSWANPDSINVGSGPRNAGGTRERKAWSNSDEINVGRGPTKGNQE